MEILKKKGVMTGGEKVIERDCGFDSATANAIIEELSERGVLKLKERHAETGIWNEVDTARLDYILASNYYPNRIKSAKRDDRRYKLAIALGVLDFIIALSALLLSLAESSACSREKQDEQNNVGEDGGCRVHDENVNVTLRLFVSLFVVFGFLFVAV